jgi:hypothetical protein
MSPLPSRVKLQKAQTRTVELKSIINAIFPRWAQQQIREGEKNSKGI